ncbi:SixA phosphatase family protein [Roseivivax isoporae]|uniref:SixA phosphatase family protein n=1 Tax=Roseivivax isoporae TaxID=591206 RepID=UPI0004B1E3B9|nr:histidine phosphatase family protein [Roseivivax isoporae]
MPRLFLMRHAKSDWSLGEDDHARPLNPRGRKSAEALGDWMRAHDYLPDQVLCSSSTRTRETLARLDIDAPVRFEDRLYHADPHTILRALHHADGEAVLVIGHNPGFAEFAGRIVEDPPVHPRFRDYPTGATLVADLPGTLWPDLAWGEARTVDFVVPRELV